MTIGERKLRDTLISIFATVDAIAEMSRTPGLWVRAQRHLKGVLESALAAHPLPGGVLHPNAPLVARVGDYEACYVLDLRKRSVTILSIARFDAPQRSAEQKPDQSTRPIGARRLGSA